MSKKLTEGNKETASSTNMGNTVVPMHQTTQDSGMLDSQAVADNVQREETGLPNHSEQPSPEHLTAANTLAKLREICACPPQGLVGDMITHVAAIVLIWAVTWSLIGRESLPGGSLFGILVLFLCSAIGGKVMGQIKLPGLPPLPPLFGMLLAGFILRNIPLFSGIVQINVKLSAALRNVALSVILALAGLGLDPKALNKLKAVCLRLTLGPCITEACAAAVLGHFLMNLPWAWGFMLGFVLGAVSPAVVVLSMLFLQAGGYGVDKGIPTLLIAAGSFDDIVAITGFNTFLGMAFSTGSTVQSLLRGVLEVIAGAAAGGVLGIFIWYCPSKDQKFLVWKRAFFVMGLAVFSVTGSKHFGFPGSGGLCTIVLAFLAGFAWSEEKIGVQEIVTVTWEIFQPFLFGLIGAEISVVSLGPETVGLCMATLAMSLTIRVTATFLLVSGAGFDFKEKIFISLAWIPKATVQAAIGSVALDTARSHGDKKLEEYGLNILTIAFLAILITAPTGALVIGLTGPKLLHKTQKGSEEDLTKGHNEGETMETPEAV